MVPLFNELNSEEDSEEVPSVKNVNKQREVNGKKNEKDYYFQHCLLKANRIAELHERLWHVVGKFGIHFPSAYVKLGQHLCIVKSNFQMNSILHVKQTNNQLAYNVIGK